MLLKWAYRFEGESIYKPCNRYGYCKCEHLKADHVPGPCYMTYCECCPKCQTEPTINRSSKVWPYRKVFSS